MTIKLAIIAATLFAASTASAGDAYVGIGAGQSKLKGDAADFIKGTGAKSDFKDGSGKVFIGAKFNRFLGVETSYNYLGHYDASIAKPFQNASVQARALGVDAVLTVPVTERFGLVGKAGVARVRADGHINGHQMRGYDTGAHYGLGVQYKVSDRFAVRGEVERHRADFHKVRNNIDSANVSLVYTFGRKPVAVTTVSYTAPAPVAAPAPAPVAAPAPAPEAPVVTTTKKIRE